MLRFAVTDLAGEHRAIPQQYTNALVTIPYLDSRKAELSLHADDDKVCAEVLALARMLKAWYVVPGIAPLLVFWGPILTPTWTLKAGEKTLKVEAHDMSLRMKNHHIGNGDPTTFDVGYTGIRALRDAAKNTAAENTAGIPDLGIGNGVNTHPGNVAATVLTAAFAVGDATMHVESTAGFGNTGTLHATTHSITYTGRTGTTFTGCTYASGSTLPVGTGVQDDPANARTLAVNNGDEVWQRSLDIANDPFGPDVRLRPDDSTGGQYALLDTLDKREHSEGGTRDKRFEVIFQAGFGTETVTEFEYAPQGASVRNRAIVTKMQTASDGTETTTTKKAKNLASQLDYGIYESWEAYDGQETTLKGKAEAKVYEYSRPPQNFSFKPRSDAAQRFFYGRDFEEGEVISCAAHFGGKRIWLPGFVTEVRLRQLSSTGQTQAEIDAIPDVGASGDVTDG